MKNIVCVTGASGHVGANLVRSLLEAKRAVRVLIHNDSRGIEGLDLDVVKGDILNKKSVSRAVRGCDVVYHLAAAISIVGDKSGFVRLTNVEGTRNIVRACLDEGVRRLVHFSSIHAYTPFPRSCSVNENSSLAGRRSPAYDQTKAEGHRLVLEGIEKGLDAVIIAPTGIVGPHDYKLSAMGAVLVKIYKNQLFGLVKGGYNWVDVRDVVWGAMKAEQTAAAGSQFILSGEWRSIRDLAKSIHRMFRVRVPGFVSPMWLARLAAPFVEYYSLIRRKEPHFTPEALVSLRNHCRVDRSRAETELNFKPRPLDQSIEDTIRWYGERGVLE